jgi:uncharacterized protein (UPF0332 family)
MNEPSFMRAALAVGSSQKDLVRKTGPDSAKAKELLAMAERDLKAAADNLGSGNYDWAVAIAYNAMLSGGRALMASNGYSPVSEAHHPAVVQSCAAVLPLDATGLASTFNRYRVRRHDVIYGEAESVGKEEAKRAIENAKLFVKKMKAKVEKS